MGTPADTDALQYELRYTQATLSRIEQEVLCGVCRELFVAPVVFPCGHTFCSLCARRYMLHHSICPDAHCKKPATTDQLRPVRALELVTLVLSGNKNAASSSDRPRDHRHRPFLAPGATRSMLKDKLGAVGLPIDGAIDVLHARYREYVLLWNANLDSAQPRSEATIAENIRRAEQKQRENKNNVKSKGQRAIAFRKQPAPTPLQNDHPDAPRQGDDFQTLMEKVRRRENRPAAGVRRAPSRNGAVSGVDNATSSAHDEIVPVVNSGRDETTAAAAAAAASAPSGANDSEVNKQREPSPVPTESATESDLALIQAADHATQSQEQNNTAMVQQETSEQVNIVPERGESPTESDLMLIEAADLAVSQSQELLQDARPEAPADDNDSMESIPTQPPSPVVPETPPRPETNQIDTIRQQPCSTSATTVLKASPRIASTNRTPQRTIIPETPEPAERRRRTSSPIIPETPPSAVARARTGSRTHTHYTSPSLPGRQPQFQPTKLFSDHVHQLQVTPQPQLQQRRIAQPAKAAQAPTQRYGAGHISIGPRHIQQNPRPNVSTPNSSTRVNERNPAGPPVPPPQPIPSTIRGAHSAQMQSTTGNGNSSRANNDTTIQPSPQANSKLSSGQKANNQQTYTPRRPQTRTNYTPMQAPGATPSATTNNQNNRPHSATPSNVGSSAMGYVRQSGVSSAPQVRQPPIATPPNRNGNAGNGNWRQGVSNTTQPFFSQPTQQFNTQSSQLTAEQRERIERNRRRAISIQLAKRRRLSQQQQQQQQQR